MVVDEDEVKKHLGRNHDGLLGFIDSNVKNAITGKFICACIQIRILIYLSILVHL
jgi:hypothetical protein